MGCIQLVFDQLFSSLISKQVSWIKKIWLKSKLNKLIEAEICAMERMYDCSIINSDSFYRYVKYHNPFCRIHDCIIDTETEEENIIKEIVDSYDEGLSAEERRLVTLYFEKIYSVVKKFYEDYILTTSERYLLAEFNKKYNRLAHLTEEKIGEIKKYCEPITKNNIEANAAKFSRKGYLFIDNAILPFDTVEVLIEPYNESKHYIIHSSYYEMEYYMLDVFIIYVTFQYQLHSKDVNDRLAGFDKILRIIDAEKLELQIEGETHRQELHTDFIDNLGDLPEKTRIWMEQMKLICTLERKYNTKFSLPTNLSDADFYALEVFRDVVEKKPVAALLVSEMEDYEELQGGEITEDLNLPDLYLFGKRFCSIKGRIEFEKEPVKCEDGNVALPLIVEFEQRD